MTSVARRKGIGATVAFGVLAAVGCGGSSAGSRPPATAAGASAGDDATAGLMEHHRYHHHGGVTLWIAMSLDTLGVSPEQRAAVIKIRTDLRAAMGTARAAEQNLNATLADSLAAASFDAATVNAGVAQVIGGVVALQDASVEALNALHGLLTPSQRAALVDKVEAHWVVWLQANAEERGTERPKSGHLAMLATELGLTPDQVETIRAGLGERRRAVPPLDPQAMVTHLRAFRDAFRNRRFDARGLVAARSANAHLVGWGAAHLAYFVATVSPVLTSQQRATFVQRLRAHATHDPRAEGSS